MTRKKVKRSRNLEHVCAALVTRGVGWSARKRKNKKKIDSHETLAHEKAHRNKNWTLHWTLLYTITLSFLSFRLIRGDSLAQLFVSVFFQHSCTFFCLSRTDYYFQCRSRSRSKDARKTQREKHTHARGSCG